jgi:ElaA protein
MLSIIVKQFKELTINELYGLLKLRSEVFVVEQDCVYQDIDEKDKKAIHVLGLINEEIVAYSRIFKPGDYFEEAAIGRVVVDKKYRGFGYANNIMNFSIQKAEELFNQSKIKVSAQTYLEKFYNNLGFNQVGEEYLEDGIPHIAMVKSKI